MLPDLAALAALDDRLREIATDPHAVTAAIGAADAALLAARARGDDRATARLLGYLGNAHRLAGHPDDAAAHLQASLDLSDAAGDPRTRTVARIRLGEAYRCGDRLDASETCLRTALAETTSGTDLADLRDFALQHLGTCLTDQGRLGEAALCLEEALELRQAKGDAPLVASTEAALSRARQSARHR